MSAAAGAHSYTVRWGAPHGGAKVIRYQVADRRLSGRWSGWTSYTVGRKVHAKVIGGTAGTLHEVRVRAASRKGWGPWSHIVSVRIPAAAGGGSGTPHATGVSPGSYAGSGYRFYVSPDGTHVQDVSLDNGFHSNLSCTPGGTFSDTSFNIASLPIAADGSFTGAVTESGVRSNAAATYTYTFTGRVQGTTASGQIREDVTYNDGTAYSCTTGTAPWTMTRETQGSQAAATPAAGSYSGSGYRFYVSAAGTRLQDVSLDSGFHANLACASGTTFTDTSFNIPDLAIAADGSFTGSATQTGVRAGVVATYTYTISGHFHGLNSSGAQRAAGQLREDVTYNDGTAQSCTTGPTAWTMGREAQGSQVAAPPLAGSYTGSGYAFTVSADHGHVQNVALASGFHANLSCTPGTTLTDVTFAIPDLVIAADGSFNGTATTTGVLSGVTATYTYRISGHFHGLSSSGAQRAAGQIREDVTYDNGTAYSCTTGTAPWTMAH